MGRPRKFKTAKALSDAWEEYKIWCDSREATAHAFSAKNAEFVSEKRQRKVTYTIEGFCVWAGLPRQSFYATYADSGKFCDIVTRMREECEVDARMKFELGEIDTRLAPLWMSKHGYGIKAEAAPPDQREDDPLTKSLKEEFGNGVL